MVWLVTAIAPRARLPASLELATADAPSEVKPRSLSFDSMRPDMPGAKSSGPFSPTSTTCRSSRTAQGASAFKLVQMGRGGWFAIRPRETNIVTSVWFLSPEAAPV